MAPKNRSSNKLPSTSRDVARLAGVSQSSVSRVFTNVGGNRVSTATRERILKAAGDLGYRPDRVAIALRKGYSDEIAAIAVETPGNSSVLAEWMTLAQARAWELGYSLGIYLFHGLDKHARHSFFASVMSRHPIGIIGSSDVITSEDWQTAAKMGVQACVLSGLEPVEYAPTQVVPLKQALYLAAKHLFERGHKHIARAHPRIMDPLEMVADSLILDGIRMAADETGGTLTEMPMTLDFASAYQSVGELLHTQNHPTAIIGNRDEYCFYLLKALSAHGVRVPQDVALVGINDGPFCELSNPALTSVGFDLQTSTANSIEAIDAIVHGKTPNPEWFIFPPPRLTVRESS